MKQVINKLQHHNDSYFPSLTRAFPGGSPGKESPLQCRKPGFDPWVGKIPWRRERLPPLVFWPGEFHGLYSPWGHGESDMTEQPSLALLSGDYVKPQVMEGNKLSGYSQVPASSFPLILFTQSQSGAKSYRTPSWERPRWCPVQASITPAWTVSTSQVTMTSRPHSSTSSRNVSLVGSGAPNRVFATP